MFSKYNINTITYNYNANIWLFGLNSRTGGTLVTATNSGTTFTFSGDTGGSAILKSYIMSIASNLTNTFFVNKQCSNEIKKSFKQKISSNNNSSTVLSSPNFSKD